MEVEKITCPNCGAALKVDDAKCPYCDSPIVVNKVSDLQNIKGPLYNKYVAFYKKRLCSNNNDYSSKLSLGIVLTKMKQYTKSLDIFDELITENPMDDKPYYFWAISSLNGSKAFLTPRTVVDEIINKLDNAISINQCALYYLFKVYILYDHHYRKGYRIIPDYKDLLNEAEEYGLNHYDYDELFGALGVEIPAAIKD